LPCPPAIRNTGNWFEIFAFAAVTGPALARHVESELAALEAAAAHTAAPTPDLADVLSACYESGRQVAVAATSAGTRQLLAAGADAIITTMADLAARIRGEHPESLPACRHQPDA
jgi:hypothetical protein